MGRSEGSPHVATEHVLLLRVTWIGLAAAAVGAVAGVVMILAGGDPGCADCSAHPQAAEGTTVVAIAVAIGALLWLVSSYVMANTPIAARAEHRES